MKNLPKISSKSLFLYCVRGKLEGIRGAVVGVNIVPVYIYNVPRNRTSIKHGERVYIYGERVKNKGKIFRKFLWIFRFSAGSP